MVFFFPRWFFIFSNGISFLTLVFYFFQWYFFFSHRFFIFSNGIFFARWFFIFFNVIFSLLVGFKKFRALLILRMPLEGVVVKKIF